MEDEKEVKGLDIRVDGNITKGHREVAGKLKVGENDLPKQLNRQITTKEINIVKSEIYFQQAVKNRNYYLTLCNPIKKENKTTKMKNKRET